MTVSVCYKKLFIINLLHFKYTKIGIGSGCISRADTERPLLAAIPLLPDMGTFSCWVSPLARFVPP